MTRARSAPVTRSSLLRSARRLDQVQRGAALLKRKRQSLVEELFSRARTAVTSREAIDAQAQRAWRSIWVALSSNGSDGLKPLGWPAREVDVEMESVEIWGLRAAALTSDGGFILAGSSTSLAGDRHGRGFGGDDYWLVKLTPEAGGLRS